MQTSFNILIASYLEPEVTTKPFLTTKAQRHEDSRRRLEFLYVALWLCVPVVGSYNPSMSSRFVASTSDSPDNLRCFLAGQPLRNVLDIERLY